MWYFQLIQSPSSVIMLLANFWRFMSTADLLVHSAHKNRKAIIHAVAFLFKQKSQLLFVVIEQLTLYMYVVHVVLWHTLANQFVVSFSFSCISITYMGEYSCHVWLQWTRLVHNVSAFITSCLERDGSRIATTSVVFIILRRNIGYQVCIYNNDLLISTKDSDC
jgi:hypothetical protein